MTVNRREYTAQLVSTVRTIDVPAHDVVHPPVFVYSQGFESFVPTLPHTNPDGWMAVSGVNGAPDAGGYQSELVHSGVRSMLATGDGVDVRTAMIIGRTMTGLQPGREYIFAVWFYQNNLTASTFRLGVDGIGYAPAAAVPATTWQQYFYTFTATATTHKLLASTVAPTGNNDTDQLGGFFDDITLTQKVWVEHVPDHYADPQTYPLAVVDGTVTLDEGVQPYMTVGLDISRPAASVLALLDPALSPRLVLTATDTPVPIWSSVPVVVDPTIRTFNGLVRSRTVDHANDTVSVTFVSDDVLLQDDKLVATAPDTSNLARQGSVRAIAQYCVTHAGGGAIAAGAADADFTSLSPASNLMPNGSIENGTTGWASSGFTVARSSARAFVGASSLQATATAAGSQNVNAAGATNTGPGVNAGTRYTFAVYVYSNTVARTIGVRMRYYSSANANLGETVGPTVTSRVGAWTRITVSAVAPANSSFAYPYITFAGVAVGEVHFLDAATLFEGTGLDTDGVTPIGYFDGDTPGTANYGYAWTGAARNSASTRTPVFDRDPDNLTWQPGDSAWDFLSPILTQAGLRLFCDETRTWRLVDNNYNPDGLVTLGTGNNLYEASDSTDRDATAVDGSPLFIDSALVKYTWTDRFGNSQTRYDAFSLPGAKSSHLFEVNRPYPGPGAALYIVTRNNGRGHALGLTVRQDWSVTPSQQVVATLPETESQVGYVSSVSWGLGSDDMAVFTRGLIQTPPTAWFYEAAGLSWDALPPGSSWANG